MRDPIIPKKYVIDEREPVSFCLKEKKICDILPIEDSGIDEDAINVQIYSGIPRPSMLLIVTKVEKIRKMQIQSQMTFNSQIEMRGQRSKKMIKVTQQKSVAIAVLSISKTNLVFN